jgi:protein-disulfide isomerase
VNRFWIILTVVIVALVGLFIATKPKTDSSAEFKGDAKQILADDHVRNARDKKVVLIEYADFQCPTCEAFYPLLKELETSYRDHVSFVFRHFPIRTAHNNAQAAALAAEAAGKQGKFFEMHDRLFETQQTWRQAASSQQPLFESYAEELGLDMTKFKQDYAAPETATRINRDVSSGSQFNVAGTPTFVLNGKKIANPQSLDAFKKVLDDAIKSTGGTPPPATSEPAAN